MSIPGAFIFACRAHFYQKDKSGAPYILHPARVCLRVRERDGSDEAQIAALLHDTVEDTDVTFTEIRNRFGERVTDLVDLLTHRPGETRRAYIARVATDRDASLVKRCDMIDNLDPRRMRKLDRETQDRLTDKYSEMLEWLGEEEERRLIDDSNGGGHG